MRACQAASRAVVLASRPARNAAVSRANFDVVSPPPASSPPLPSGTFRAETLFLSVDPYLRCRFNEDTGVDYTQPYQVGQPLTSAGIGRVVDAGDGSHGFAVGTYVFDAFDAWPWASHVTVTPSACSVRRLPVALGAVCDPTHVLGAVGQTGVTAWCGVMREAAVRAGDVVVVSGAAGAVGSVAVQLAKAQGAYVVAIAGSRHKVWRVQAEFGADAGVDYTSPAFEAELAAAVAAGGGRPVALFFDNVGGHVADAVVRHMDPATSHWLLCGAISTYDTDAGYPPPLSAATAALGVERRRYLVLNHKAAFGEAVADLLYRVAAGRLVAPQTVTRRDDDGVAAAPDAFLSMMRGGNVGKALVQTAECGLDWHAARVVRDFLPPAVRGWVARRLPV